MNDFQRGFEEELEKIAYSLAQVSKVVRKAKGIGRLPKKTEKLKTLKRVEAPIGEATTMAGTPKGSTQEFLEDMLFRKQLKQLRRERPLKKVALDLDPELAARLAVGEPVLPPIPPHIQSMQPMPMQAVQSSITPDKVKAVGGAAVGMLGQYLEGEKAPRRYLSYNPPQVTSGFRY